MNRKESMLVVPDANALISDFKMRGAAFEIIRRHGRDLRIKLAVPKVAFEDAVFHQNDAYLKAHHSIQRAFNALEKASIDELNPEQIPKAYPDNSGEYQSFLLRRIKTMGEIVEHSDEVFRRVSERCRDRRRPFAKQGDAGYKDALIWETIVDLLRSSAAKILFVTIDPDFLDESKTLLHNDLIHDLDVLSCRNRVVLFKSLSELQEKYLLRKMRRDKKLEVAYQTPGNPVFSIPDFLSSSTVGGMLQIEGREPSECCLPSSSSKVYLHGFSNWRVGSDVEVRSIGNSKKLCIFEASVDCIVRWRNPFPIPHRVITTDEQDRLVSIEYLPESSNRWEIAPRRCRFRMELLIDNVIGRWVSWSDQLLECSPTMLTSH